MSESDYPLAADPALEWRGGKRRYDLVRELVLAVLAVTVLAVVASVLFSSPDEKQVTIAQWANAAPVDFVTTALSELDRTSGTAGYGPPYTHTSGASQNIVGSFSLQRLIGVHIPIDSAHDFVLDPLSIAAPSDPPLRSALSAYGSASATQRSTWTAAYGKALAHASVQHGNVVVASGQSGPVGLMMRDLLSQAQSGGLDGALVSAGNLFQTDYTKPLLLLSDGSYLEGLAAKQHLLGNQWGMMNEAGNYPGQAWLWLYTFWYQIKPFSTSANADAQIWAIMALLSLALVSLPLLPGLRSIPRYVPLYRLIWRDYYRQAEANHPQSQSGTVNALSRTPRHNEETND